MKPAEYLEHLELCTELQRLSTSDLRPCSSADIMSVEREAGMSLPEQYVDFLCQVGAGAEHGGLARWFHMDMTRPGNIIEHSHGLMGSQLKQMREAGVAANRFPRGLLAIYDACDGVVFGFVPNSGSTYKAGVYAWDCEEFALEQVAGDFCEFLDYLTADGPC